MKERVVVAMSGGVDSAVAAALLKQQGYEVVGLTMCFNLADSEGKRPSCCGLSGIEDARRVAHKLGIRHYVVNMQKNLEEYVINDFCHEYLKGRTPNPCVRCNQYLKFGILLKKALALGAQYLATGHYARIVRHGYHLSPITYHLKKATDLNKDQSYFLYRLTQKQMKHIIFPLGNYTKNQVRQIARKFELPVAEKLGSQEICFLPNSDYRSFLNARFRADIKSGLIVDREGNILGQHQGVSFYTIGQRRGLGIAKGRPLYIIKIDPAKNQITVGAREEAYKKEFMVKEAHFFGKPPKKKVVLGVKIRYNHKETQALVSPLKNKINPLTPRSKNRSLFRIDTEIGVNFVRPKGRGLNAAESIKVVFIRPQFAVTPGQSAVFYDKGTVIGGGIII